MCVCGVAGVMLAMSYCVLCGGWRENKPGNAYPHAYLHAMAFNVCVAYRMTGYCRKYWRNILCGGNAMVL